MMQRRFQISIWFILLILCGCFLKPDRIVHNRKEIPKVGRAPLSELYKDRAMRYAMDNEFQKSLYYLKISSRLDPEDRETPKKIKGMEAFLASESDRHLLRGKQACRNNLNNLALKEFLTTLRYKPNNEKAFTLIKNISKQCALSGYRVKKGDTLRMIAKNVYKDPGKDFLIAYFMDIDIKESPVPGKNYHFPVLSKELAKIPNDRKRKKRIVRFKKNLPKSRKNSTTNKQEKSGDESGAQNDEGPKESENSELVNAALYEKGKILLNQDKKYVESLAVFERINPTYKDVGELISQIRAHLEELAEEHYRKGVKLFVNEELAKAIKEWEETMYLNPDHKKAKKDIQDARVLLEKLEEVE